MSVDLVGLGAKISIFIVFSMKHILLNTQNLDVVRSVVFSRRVFFEKSSLESIDSFNVSFYL